MLRYTCLPKIIIPEGAGAVFQAELLAYIVCMYEGKNLFRIRRALDLRHEIDSSMHSMVIDEWNQIMGFLGPVHEMEKSKKDMDCNSFINLGIDLLPSIVNRIEPNIWDSLIIKMRNEFYFHNRKYFAERNCKETRLAIHIRNLSKGDTCIGKESLPWQLFNYDYGKPNQNPEFYANLYTGVVSRNFYHFKNLHNEFKIDIYSTGEEKDFEGLIDKLKISGFENINLFLNRPSYLDFLDMVSAENLIMAQSSFSYIIALLSNSKKFIRNNFRLRLPSDVAIFRDYVALNYSLNGKLHSVFDDTVRLIKTTLKK